MRSMRFSLGVLAAGRASQNFFHIPAHHSRRNVMRGSMDRRSLTLAGASLLGLLTVAGQAQAQNAPTPLHQPRGTAVDVSNTEILAAVAKATATSQPFSNPSDRVQLAGRSSAARVVRSGQEMSSSSRRTHLISLVRSPPTISSICSSASIPTKS